MISIADKHLILVTTVVVLLLLARISPQNSWYAVVGLVGWFTLCMKVLDIGSRRF